MSEPPLKDEPRTPSGDGPAPTEAPPVVTPFGSPPASAQTRLEEYFRSNRARYTDDALRAAARDAGHDDATVEAAMARATDTDAAAPVRARARRAITWAYVITFVVLVAGMTLNNGGGVLPSATILLVSLLIGLGLSRLMIRRAGPSAAFAAVLAGPVIVLVIVAGLCVATGLPLGPIHL